MLTQVWSREDRRRRQHWQANSTLRLRSHGTLKGKIHFTISLILSFEQCRSLNLRSHHDDFVWEGNKLFSAAWGFCPFYRRENRIEKRKFDEKPCTKTLTGLRQNPLYDQVWWETLYQNVNRKVDGWRQNPLYGEVWWKTLYQNVNRKVDCVF